MGLWAIPSDVLARLRFATSPMAEVVGALGNFTPGRRNVDQVFALRHQAAFREMLAEYPGRRAVFEHSSRPGWLADFLSIPPPGTAPTMDEELHQLSGFDESELVRQLRESTPGRLPPILLGGAVRTHILGLLEWTWIHTVATDWPRRERILRADIVTRTHRLAEHGFAGVLQDLGRRREWSEGHLRVNDHDRPTRQLGGSAQLLLVPVHANGSWVGWDEPHRYAVYYPVSGALADTGRRRPGGVDRLIGTNRARLLAALDAPQTTSNLAATSGLPIGAVGNHLKVLLEAGVVLKRRSGREVLYWRTAVGDELLAASR
ncbi:ArsR/SmtB family transcription factor [Flexivirga caeni]|uniref:ArsR family transcriptional regulator n=1 Tax=Flexivirga caeni TaxID=2294115 RepID=A0A3M9M499_9MICO|nr:winged helix-turn-helix domain-containing protein [Flexivirga caeni]RNI20316.1 ArsR family transcriptional regulator [Flexivirga caeni]